MTKTNATESNAIDLLKADHETVKDLFDQFEDTADATEKEDIIQQAIHELKIHATVEEEIFYPAVREELEEEEVMNEAEVEHHLARILIAELEQSSEDQERRNARFKVLAESVRHHIKEEEGQMFSDIQDTDLDLDDIGQRMLSRKEELADGNIPEDKEHEMISRADVGRNKGPVHRERTIAPREKSAHENGGMSSGNGRTAQTGKSRTKKPASVKTK